MDAEKKRQLASKAAERRAASFAKLKKTGAFKEFVRRDPEEHRDPPRKLARA
jgi:hypothetical protein